jgi:hypothetical protein
MQALQKQNNLLILLGFTGSTQSASPHAEPQVGLRNPAAMLHLTGDANGLQTQQ